jgi:8-oxo-dGTP pyrophosphatase MutT (NUDIX family)
VAFERIDSEEVFSGKLIRVRRERFRHDDGAVVQRELAVHPGAAVIVAHDGENVFLVRQPREVVGEEALLELPAGKLDAGEEPERTAQRELGEEIGKRAGTLEPLATVYASPGFSDETFHLFLATDLADAAADPEEEERITIEPVPLADLDDLIPRLRDSKTLIGLLLLRRLLATEG